MIAAWIGAAYWFTASTSFANPAITIARSLSNTFAGIRPIDVAGFVAAQLVGALLALWVARYLFDLARVSAVTAVQEVAAGTTGAGARPKIVRRAHKQQERRDDEVLR
jgi:glycerol uptake facilitator-like aquaporin